METVFVLLPVHNRRELTRRFLGCLRAQTHPDLRLLVVDDGSTDGTEEMVRAEYPCASCIRGDGHWWWGGSLQRGFEWLRQQGPRDDDVVLIINDDTRFDADYIGNAVRILRQQPDCLLLSRMVDMHDGTVRETGIEADFRRMTFRVASDPDRINCLSTRGLFLSWRTMRAVGSFRPRLLPHYWSDYEFTIRAVRRGFKCITDASVALQANLETTGQRQIDRLRGWTLVRQLFSIKCPANPVFSTVFVILAAPMRWMPAALMRVWARSLGRVVWQGLLHRPLSK